MLLNLQILRAVAAFMVVCVHLDEILSGLGLPVWGHGGVHLFFVISGFIMVHATHEKNVTPASFLINRTARIVPIYWLLTFAVFMLAITVPSLFKATTANFTDLIKSLFFIPYLKASGLIQPLLFVGWSLNYEMFFYALFAVALMLPKRSHGYIFLLTVLALLSGFGALTEPQNAVMRFYTDPVMMHFAFGVLLALAAKGIPEHASDKVKAAVFIMGALFLAVVWRGDISNDATKAILISGLASAIVVACALALETWGIRVNSQIGLTLGAASYSIYLIHPFVTQAFQKAVSVLEIEGVGLAIMLLLCLTSVGVIGVIFYRVIELPLSALAKTKLKTFSVAYGK